MSTQKSHSKKYNQNQNEGQKGRSNRGGKKLDALERLLHYLLFQEEIIELVMNNI